MYEITVEHEFCAAHAITVGGVREPAHGHNWRVTATVEGALDADGLVCDFHTLRDTLVNICDPFDNQDLNLTPPFDAINPTAEHVARHIGDALATALGGALGAAARVSGITVTEAPGCRATYRL